MKTLKVNLKNCYGICELNYDFDFSNNRTYVIYAPNGVMKTSFAKTFKDFSFNIESKDLIFPERITERIINDENDIEVNREVVFVIEPYNEQFSSDKLSTLLVSKDLKRQYDDAYKELEEKKIEFVKKLKAISQSSDCEQEFVSSFMTPETDNFFELLISVLSQLDGKQTRYEFRYNDIFDKKGNVKKFLDKHQKDLDLYVNHYEELISKSSFFKKSNHTFGTYQANELLKSISDNSFFEAGHSIELADKARINSSKDFASVLQAELDKVLNDEKLKKIFEKVDKAIGANVEMRAFKEVIEKNNLLLIELNDYELFKKNVWIGYLDQINSDVEALVDFYNSKKQKIDEIISIAKDEKTEWEKSIEEFNERFKGLPFKLGLKNKEDVILKTITPSVEFIFHDREDEKVIERDELLEVLSQGERRALYLLNIIFEIQARRQSGQETVFIIDDIADSFDYKNKYAIIEYLNDISKIDIFAQLIFTHNYDFYRSVSGRIVGNGGNRRKCKINVVKTVNEIKLVEEKYQNNPFETWKKNFSNDSMLIASIPFVRNIAEYIGLDSECIELTKLLHIKNGSTDITISNLEDVIKKVLQGNNLLNLPNNTDMVLDRIYAVAEGIIKQTDEFLELENKIVLSIAIRLKVEQFMIQEINDQSFVDTLTNNQTYHLIAKYKELHPSEDEKINLLEQVNLMTPENIHLNSFMYEPILDLGDEHLKDLYRKVKVLI